MLIVDQARLWLRALLARGRVESDMEKEMRLHLELETQHNLELGMSPARPSGGHDRVRWRGAHQGIRAR